MLKNIETRVLFTKTSVNHEWNLNSLQKSQPDIHHIYSSKFSSENHPLKNCEDVPFIFILMFFTSSNSWDEFSFSEISCMSCDYEGCYTHTILCFSKREKKKTYLVTWFDCGGILSRNSLAQPIPLQVYNWYEFSFLFQS